MGTKSPKIYNDGYMGHLTEAQCDKLMSIKEKDNVPELEHTIFVFPYELIVESLETNKSIRQIVKEKNIDWHQYIKSLRSYQTVGTEFLLNSTRAMIGDSVGLGKTAEIAATINVLKQEGKLTRFIMAVETSALMQTQVELIKFTGLNIVALPSESTKLKRKIEKTDWNNVDGIVIKHCTLKSNTFNLWLAKNLDKEHKSTMFNMFILDESSVIKNDETQLYQYCQHISNMMDRVYMLNATAFEKHILDIYYQFNLMDQDLLPEVSNINKNYCTFGRITFWKSIRQPNGSFKPQMQYRWRQEGYKNQSVFKNSLKYVYFGRSLKDVGMNIEHIYKVYTVQPNPEQTRLIAAGFHSNEVLNCPSLLDNEAVLQQGFKPLLLNRESNPKLDRLCELAETELNNISFMVYCYHIDAQYKIKEELEKIGRKVVIINGQDPAGSNADMEKLDRMQKFNSGEYDVIVTNLQKSLNLYGAHAMVLYSNTATVGRLEQIRGRIDRHVDNDIRIFIMLLYEGTSEYTLMTETAKARGKASRDLILDSETAIDYFVNSIET